MAKEGRRSIGSNGDISPQVTENMPTKKGKYERSGPSKLARFLTVFAYIISVSTAAVLLSAYYVFLWVPQPSDPLQRIRPTNSPLSLAQQGNTQFPGSSNHHYPQVGYPSAMDSTKHMPPSRGSKKSHHYKTTIPPNLLPKPQNLVRTKKGTNPTPRQITVATPP